MGNSPSTDLGGTESHRGVAEVMETKDEKSSGFKELTNPISKSRDDGSSIPNPLQWRHQRGTEGEIRVQIEDQGRSQERTDRNIVNPPQCRPAAGPGEVRVSGSERVRPDDAEGLRIERQAERTTCPEVSSMGNGETKSTSTVRRRGLWDENEAIGRSNERGEGRRSSEIRSANPRRRRSPDCEASSGPNSQYHTAATERVETRRTPSCPKDRRSNSARRRTNSSDEEMNEADAKADSIRHPPSSSRRSTRKTKTKERKTLFATSDSE